MNRDNLKKAIEGNYKVIFSLEGNSCIEESNAKDYFDRKKYYNIGSSIKIPNQEDYYSIVDIFIAEKNKTVSVTVKEICKCGDYYNCCDCGGNDCGCGGCWSCNACDECLSE